MSRGASALGFSLLGLVLCFSGGPQVIAVGIVLIAVLWIFSFLDAYFTAIEINRGIDDVIDGQNPRVAVTLNLLTAGFGYFYLGERAKGPVIFVIVQVSRFAFPRMAGVAGGVISLSQAVVQCLMAADAYRIAHRQLKQYLGPEFTAPTSPPLTRLPVQVPVALACLAGFGLASLAGLGFLASSTEWGRRPAARGANTPAHALGAPAGSDRLPMSNNVKIRVVDSATAVQDVRRGQRKLEAGKDEIPNLQQDVRRLGDALRPQKIDASDAIVWRYYRALAVSTLNRERELEGEPSDVAAAQTARADLDKIIAQGSVRTYVAEITPANVEYLAGMIARNQLRDERAAYAYWEKCSADGHAGCMNNLAEARVTGAGGQKVDLREALELNTSVYKSGINYGCAGAHSAMSIAYINYFTGVSRPGDDELVWTRKADDLFDQLEDAEDDPNVCHRAEDEVGEFLFQLSRVHRDDNILQDALSRAGDDSTVKAMVQLISGAINESAFDAAVDSDKAPGERCLAYFYAMWYAELRSGDTTAKRYHQRLAEIGKFHCGQQLAYANKYKF